MSRSPTVAPGSGPAAYATASVAVDLRCFARLLHSLVRERLRDCLSVRFTADVRSIVIAVSVDIASATATKAAI